MSKLSRRSFITGAAGAAAMGALSAVALADAPAEGAPEGDAAAEGEGAPQGEGGEGGEGGPQGQGGGGGGAPMMASSSIEDPEWRTAPNEADFPISAEYDCQVLVCGTGYAGATALRKAAVDGKQVIGIEKQWLETFNLFGGDIGTHNSTYQKSIGIPEVDPAEYYNNWQMCCANRAEPDLLKYYANHAGEAFDFFTAVSPGIEDTYTTYAWESIPDEWTSECGAYHTYPGAVSIKQYGSSQVPIDNINDAVDNYGAQQFWGHELKMLTQDEDGRVTGAIAEDLDNEVYIKINASDAVIIACGDFIGNATMSAELLTEIMDTNPTSEYPSGMGRDGMGQKAAYWAGGAFEIGPRSGMGGVSGNPMGIWKGSHILLIDKDGYRVGNEAFAHNFVSGIPAARRESGLASVFGSNFYEPLSHGPIGHLNLDDWTALDEQKTIFTADHEDSGPDGFDYSGTTVYCSNDPLTLAGYLGYEGEAAEQFAATIERYNEMAANGKDEDFAKPASVFQPIEPPYFGTYSGAGGGAGCMVSLAGMFATRDCQVRHRETFAPIPGLYVAGNCLGGRFPLQYTSPMNGVSISWAVTSGYQAGEAVAKL
jgi:succinate dehydrogenase/fumarate reductase flavoprotein subunit